MSDSHNIVERILLYFLKINSQSYNSNTAHADGAHSAALLLTAISMHQLKYVFFLLISIVGNPFYQMIAYLICSEFGFGAYKETNVYQANLFTFIVILVVIFLVRLLIYAKVFYAKEYSFSLKGNSSFLYIFSERHLYQTIGILSFIVWILPLEGNIIGFLVLPLTIVLGSIVSIITFIRLLKTKKILITKNKQH